MDNASRNATVLCTLSTLRHRLANNTHYPEIAVDFAATFEKLKTVTCDVFLADHAKFFRMKEKRRAMFNDDATTPFVDPAGCAFYIDQHHRHFRARLAAQRQSNTDRP